MIIEKDKVVSINYVLKDDEGSVIDSSGAGEPLVYLHGNGNIIPGLERHLEGKTTGDKVDCVIEPADAYGEFDDNLVIKVSRADFADQKGIEVGMQFQAAQEDGMHVVTVIGVDDDEVTVDANHPLAGQKLHFSVDVSEIREASAEELEHGHVHGDHSCGDECGCEGDCDDESGECGCRCGCGH